MKNFNLNKESLQLFKLLYDTRSLQKASAQLGMSPATASRTLAKLREFFDDDLFTRCSGGLTPTFRSTALIGRIETLLDDYERLCCEDVFDPSSVRRNFRIACVDHGTFFLGSAIAKASQVSSDVSIEIREIENSWHSQLQSGELDFAILPVSSEIESCQWLALHHCQNVLISRANHPLVRLAEKNGGQLTARDCLQYRFVEVIYRPLWLYRQFNQLRVPNLSLRKIAVKTPYFISAAVLVRNSDLLAVVSGTMAQELSLKEHLAILPLPRDWASSFTPKLIWHNRSHRDPAMQWMRSLIMSSATDLNESREESTGSGVS